MKGHLRMAFLLSTFQNIIGTHLGVDGVDKG